MKLLRLLQDGQYYALGSDTAKLSNARIVVATHRDIKTMAADNTFRHDLYFRLQSHHIDIPPLRERKGDLPYLVDRFLTRAAEELGKKKPTVPKELFTLLGTYSFPGNARELEGIIFDAVSQHISGILSLESIRRKITENQPDRIVTVANQTALPSEAGDLVVFPGRVPTLKEAEEAVIEEALKRADKNQTIAAELLGISRRALNNRLRRAAEDTGK